MVHVAGPLAVAPGGALYVADVAGHCVDVRSPDGRFRAVAGNGKSGYSGDGGPAVRAELSTITDLAVAPDGSPYIADGGRVRAVGRDGLIHTVARSTAPLALALSPSGRLYLSSRSRIFRLSATGTLETVRAIVRPAPARDL